MLPVGRNMLVRRILPKPGSNILGVWNSRTQSHKSYIRSDILHPGNHSLERSSTRFLQNMYLVNEEELHELHQLHMIFPFPSHAIPFLGRCDDNLATLDVAQLHVVRVSGQFCALEVQAGELGVPVSEALAAEGLGGCLVDYFEAFVFEGVQESADGQFHHHCLAAAGWGGQDDVVIAVVDGVEGFGLDGIEKWEGEH